MTAVTKCPFCGTMTIVGCCPSMIMLRDFSIERSTKKEGEWYFMWYKSLFYFPTPEAAQAALVTKIKEYMR